MEGVIPRINLGQKAYMEYSQKKVLSEIQGIIQGDLE